MKRLLLLIMICICSACSGKWYHATKSDADFEKDYAECKLMAEKAAVTQSMTGRRKDIEIYYKTLHSCLFSKGWSNTPIEKTEVKEAAGPVVKKNEKGQFVFEGEALTLPEGSEIVKRSTSSYGPVRMEVIDFICKKGGLSYSGQVIFQKALALGFDPVPYPVDDPFFTYSKGGLENGIKWHAFAGEVGEGSWIGGVGCYWVISKKNRVVIAISSWLPPQEAKPKTPCRLTGPQGKAMEECLAFAIPWLKSLGEKKTRRFEFLKWDKYQLSIDF